MLEVTSFLVILHQQKKMLLYNTMIGRSADKDERQSYIYLGRQVTILYSHTVTMGTYSK